jgi:hypothetical protein
LAAPLFSWYTACVHGADPSHAAQHAAIDTQGLSWPTSCPPTSVFGVLLHDDAACDDDDAVAVSNSMASVASVGSVGSAAAEFMIRKGSASC